MTTSISEENTASRLKLAELANRLTDEDLGLVTSYGWSVSALLAHMAWWDQRVLILLRRWKDHGLDDSPTDSHMINESLKPLCHALDPRTAVRLWLASAEETDAEVAETSAELMAQIEASPTHFRFNRALHRYDHINDIEELIRARKTAVL